MHNITERDGFFTVREPAWHGLGTVLEDYPDRQTAKEIAMPWEPVTEPLYRKQVLVDVNGAPFEEYEEVDDARLVTRDDTHEPLGVVSDSHTLVTNSELFDIAEAIEGGDPSAVRYETGGSLKRGQKVWLLLRLAEPIVLKGDENGATICYYALQNDHVGGGSFRGQGINTRIVCDNTSRAADLEAASKGTEFVFRHTASIKSRIEEAKEALAGWRESIVRWRLINESLMDIRLTSGQSEWFVEEFIPMPPPHTISERVVANVEEARNALRGILHGPTCAGHAGTGYGHVQAAIEYQQHHRRAISAESRFKRAYLDNDRIAGDAVEIVRAAELMLV